MPFKSESGVASMFRKKQANGTNPIYGASEQGILGTEQANMDFAFEGERLGLRGGGMDMGNASNQAQSASMGSSSSSSSSNSSSNGSSSSSTDNSSGNDNNYNYRGPADLGVTTRTVDRVTAPEAKEYIGGKEYDVTPETRDERDNARVEAKAVAERAAVKKQILETKIPTSPNKKFKVKDPITGKKLTSNKKLGGLTAGEVFGWGLTLVSAGVIPAPAAITKIATGYGTIKNVKLAMNVYDTLTSKIPDEKDGDKKKPPTTIKGAFTQIAKSTAKNKIAEELGMSVKQVDEITKIGINAWNSDIADSIKVKFTETFKTAPKQKKEVNINDEVALTTGPKKKTTTTFIENDGNDRPNEVIIPAVPEFLEDIIVDPMDTPTEENTTLLKKQDSRFASSLSDMAILDFIRSRQNRRRSFFNANSGGLAGLFKVKKQ